MSGGLVFFIGTPNGIIPSAAPRQRRFFMPKTMLISFELTMPNVGSHNGKWTGADKEYYHIVALNKAQKQVVTGLINSQKANFYYNFGDGWGANVKMELVDAREASRRRKNSKGFCGYQWMCDEILQHGKILTSSERDDIAQKKMEPAGIAEQDIADTMYDEPVFK